MSTPSSKQPAKQVTLSSLPKSELVFMSVNIALIGLLLFCVNGFWHFRQLCVEKGYYVFSPTSLIWSVVGFFGKYILKYSYFKYLNTFFQGILLTKKESQADRGYRLKSIKKLSFDTLYYISMTVWAYFMFSQEYWFPSMAFGKGQCSAMYNQYPNWPQKENIANNMQIYFMIQLGVHFFSMYEMIIINGFGYRKYFQWLLHHSVATILIFFSMMSNQMTAGVTILIIHDASDIFSSFGRGFLETKFINDINMAIIYVVMLVAWIYIRLIVYPFCLLANVYKNSPNQGNFWFIIKFEYHALLAMAGVLVCMHAFWIYFLIMFGVQKMKKGAIENTHEAATKIKRVE